LFAGSLGRGDFIAFAAVQQENVSLTYTLTGMSGVLRAKRQDRVKFAID
jgi:hypothetical protein